MRLSLVSQLLLVIISVLTLTRTQTTTVPTTTDTTTTEPTTTESTTAETTTTEPTTTESTTTEPTTTESTTAETTTTETTTTETTTTEPTTTESTTAETTTDTTTTESTTAEATTTDTTTAGPTTESTTESTTDTTPSQARVTASVTTSATTTVFQGTPIFYRFGSWAGDTEIFESGGETVSYVNFSTPFTFFGRSYNNIYVNNNGLMTFNQPLPEAGPYLFPTHGSEDYIAGLWTDLDDIGLGKYYHQEYTSGSVLTRATQDINQYFPHMGFTASWVFVATWDYVQTSNMNVFNLRSAPTITFQVILISGGGFSFILMNYGDCAGINLPVEAGFDTINSTDYHVIHYANDGFYIPNLKTTSNVGVPGRWAFVVNNGTVNVVGVQMKLTSFLDLTQTGNIEEVLQLFQELVSRGVSSPIEMKLRKVQKIQP